MLRLWGARLATEITKTAAVDFRQSASTNKSQGPAPEIHEYADPSHRLAAVALAYGERPDSTVVVAPDRAERQELNLLIRADLQAQGRLAPDSKSITVHTEQLLGNPKLAAEYTPGDHIQYRQGSQSDGIATNSTVAVLAIDSNSNQLTVQTSAGDEVTYSPHLTKAMTSQSTIYREEQREIAIGERIQLNETISTKGIRKGDFATVTAISESNDLEVRTDKGSNIRLDPQEALHIDHGYAVEALRTGAPERVLISQENIAGQEVSTLARNAREVNIYTSDGLGLGRTQTVSSELSQQPQIETPANILTPEPMHVEHRRSIGR